jgi:hypothetical protein
VSYSVTRTRPQSQPEEYEEDTVPLTYDPFALADELTRLLAAGEIDGPEAVRKLDENAAEVDALMRGAAAALHAATTPEEIHAAAGHYVAAAQLKVKQESAALTIAMAVYGSDAGNDALDVVLHAVDQDVQASNATDDWRLKLIYLHRARRTLAAAMGQGTPAP